MKNKNLFKAIVKISLVSMILAMSFQFSLLPAKAAALTTVKDELGRQIQSLTSGESHLIVFTTATAVSGGPGINVVTIAFPTPGDDNTWCKTAGTLTAVGNTDGGAATALPGTLVAACTDTPDVITITGVDDLLAATVYGVLITDPGVGKLGTPAANPNKVVTVTTNNGTIDIDSGHLALAIVTNDQVTVMATVEPTFTFSISATTCDLGTIDPTHVETCGVTLTTSTNASSGYTTTIVGTHALNELYHVDTVHNIPNENTVAIDPGVSEFGVSTTAAGENIVQLTSHANCAAADHSAVFVDGASIDTMGDNTPASIASAAGPVSADANDACFAAAISTTQEAGSYLATVTFVSTGTF